MLRHYYARGKALNASPPKRRWGLGHSQAACIQPRQHACAGAPGMLARLLCAQDHVKWAPFLLVPLPGLCACLATLTLAQLFRMQHLAWQHHAHTSQGTVNGYGKASCKGNPSGRHARLCSVVMNGRIQVPCTHASQGTIHGYGRGACTRHASQGTMPQHPWGRAMLAPHHQACNPCRRCSG